MSMLIQIVVTVGIPSEAVHFTLLGYGGSFNGGVKCAPKATIDLDVTGGSSLSFPTPSWGITRSYHESDAILVPGKPDWFRSLRSGAASIAEKQLVRTEDNLNLAFSTPAGATHGVRFGVIGANPLLPAAPAIDAEIVVGLRKAAGGVDYSVSGKHDGFPNYTVTVNGTVSYFHDCVGKGENPGALKPPMDYNVNVPWTRL